jgi:hypothetical protein
MPADWATTAFMPGPGGSRRAGLAVHRLLPAGPGRMRFVPRAVAPGGEPIRIAVAGEAALLLTLGAGAAAAYPSFLGFGLRAPLPCGWPRLASMPGS